MVLVEKFGYEWPLVHFCILFLPSFEEKKFVHTKD